MLYDHNEGITATLLYKNLYLFILLGVKASVVCERLTDRGRQGQTAILTHNSFFS